MTPPVRPEQPGADQSAWDALPAPSHEQAAWDALPGADGAAPPTNGGGFTPTSIPREGANAVLSIPAGMASIPGAVAGLSGAVGKAFPASKSLAGGGDLGGAARALASIATPVAHAVEPARRWLQETANSIVRPASDAELGLANHPTIAKWARGAIDMASTWGAGALASKLSAGATKASELAEALDTDMAASKAAADPLWDQVRAAPPVSGPAIDKLLGTPDAPKAWAAAARAAANRGEQLPAFPAVRAATGLTPKQAAYLRSLDVPDEAIQAADALHKTAAAAPAAVPPDALHKMGLYLQNVIQHGSEEGGISEAQAVPLSQTVKEALAEARTQSPVLDQALKTSAQYKGMEEARAALEGLMSPKQQVVAAVARGDLPEGAVQAIKAHGTGPVRTAGAQVAGGGALAAAGHPFMGSAMVINALKSAAKGLGAGKLSQADLAKLTMLAGKTGSGRFLDVLNTTGGPGAASALPTVLPALSAAANTGAPGEGSRP